MDTVGQKEKALHPTKANIESALKAVLAKAKKDDLVLVAFEGHGRRFEGKQNAYLCLRNAKPNAVETLLSLGTLGEKLEKSAAGAKVLLVDACREGDDKEVAGVDEVKLPDGILALLSCSPGERSVESKDRTRGIFYHQIAEGIRGQAADGNDAITFASLAEYAIREVPKEAKAAKDDAKQTPKAYASDCQVVAATGGATQAIPAAEWKDYLAVWSNGGTRALPQEAGADAVCELEEVGGGRFAAGHDAGGGLSEFGIAAVGGKFVPKEAAPVSPRRRNAATPSLCIACRYVLHKRDSEWRKTTRRRSAGSARVRNWGMRAAWNCSEIPRLRDRHREESEGSRGLVSQERGAGLRSGVCLAGNVLSDGSGR